MRNSALWFSVPALALAIAAAGCGDDSSATSDGSTPPPVDAAPIPDNALHLDPSSGTLAGDGSAADPWPGLDEVIAAGLMAQVEAGATLVLHDGLHGDVSLSGDNAELITITAAPGEQPQLARLVIREGSRWLIRGLTISPSFASAPYDGNIVSLGESGESSELIVEDCFVYTELDSSGWSVQQWMDANSGVLLGRHGTNLTLRNTHILNTRFGVSLTSYDSLCQGNLISNFSGDGIRVTRDGITVSDNVIKNAYVSDADGDGNHDDAIQCFLFNVGTGTVRDVTIRGNIIINREDDGQPYSNTLQAIGFFDGPLINFLVEDNIVLTIHWHGVSLYDAQGSTIRNNVCYSRWPDDPRPWVMLGQKQDLADGNTVTGNYAHSFDFAADPNVTASDNEPITEAIFNTRLAERLAAISATFGANHPVSGHPRVQP